MPMCSKVLCHRLRRSIRRLITSAKQRNLDFLRRRALSILHRVSMIMLVMIGSH